MNKNAKLISIVFIIIFTTGFAYSIEPEITISEHAKLIDNDRRFLNINANGTLSIHNPSQNDEIYEFVLKFRNDANLKISDSQAANATRFFITSNKIYGREILANETITLNYHITGTVGYNNLNAIRESSVLDWYVDEISLDPLRLITLEKLQRKNPGTNVSPRKVIVKGENPTDFNVTIKYLNLFKTSAHNFSYFSFLKESLHTITNLQLSPYQQFNIEIIDNNSDDSTVYWVESDFATVNKITNFFTYNFTRDMSGSSKKKDDSKFMQTKTDYDIEIYKSADTNSISENETINITLIIKNPNNQRYSNLRIYEKIPSFFSLIPFPNQTDEIKDDSILFRFASIEEDSFLTLRYQLKLYEKIDEEIIYIQPAILQYNNKEIYSNGLTFLNGNFEQDKKILVEKIIRVLDNSETKITIRVKNIGNTVLRDIGVIEDVSSQIIEGDEISKQKEQARWIIRELKVGEEWEISYQIGTKDANKYIPQITGIDETRIYKSLFINEEIREYYNSEPGFLLKFLAVFAIILLITDIIF